MQNPGILKMSINPKMLLIFPKMRERGGHFWSFSGQSLPLGLAYIASTLEQDGFKVRVVDCQLPGITFNNIKTVLKNDPPDVVGISASTPCTRSAYDIATAIKEVKDDLPLVLGGPHPTALGTKVLEDCLPIDVVVMGEGERIASRLFRALYEKKDLDGIPGIAYRTSNGLNVNQRPGFITDLDSLPLPARHLFPVEKYVPVAGSYKKGPCMSMITSRGCPHQCVFCNRSLHGYAFRAHSPSKMIEEIVSLTKKYGAREISFFDDSFTENKQRIFEFCEQMKSRKLKTIWRCSARVDRLDQELLRVMHEAGCYRIGFGIESGSEKILTSIGKGISLRNALEAIRMAKREGIETIAYFMLNLPGETEKTIEETASFIKKLKPDILLCQLAYPFPGTPLRKIVEDRYKIIPEKWNDFDGRFSNDVLFLQEGVSVHLLERSFQKITRDFYLRPSYLLKSLSRLRNPSLWGRYFRIFMNILRLRVNA